MKDGDKAGGMSGDLGGWDPTKTARKTAKKAAAKKSAAKKTAAKKIAKKR